MKKLLILPMAFSGIIMHAQSQVNVVDTNNIDTSFPLSEVRSITFDGDNVFLTDTNGVNNQFPFSEVRKLTFEDIVTSLDELSINKDALSVYPNPVAENRLVARLNLEENSSINLMLRNMQGAVITSLDKNGVKGQNDIVVPINNLAAGTYILTATSNNQTFTQKIIKY